jgi:hypothetical protein
VFRQEGETPDAEGETARADVPIDVNLHGVLPILMPNEHAKPVEPSDAISWIPVFSIPLEEVSG